LAEPPRQLSNSRISDCTIAEIDAMALSYGEFEVLADAPSPYT
jgi:hypothetical protein